MNAEQIKLVIYRPACAETCRVLNLLAPRIPKATRVAHGIAVFAVPAPTVRDRNGGFGFGAFRVCRGKPQIWLAGFRPERGISDAEHREQLVETLCHELAHYEQWRDGLTIQEWGVARRARRIARTLAVALLPPGGPAGK